MAEGNRISNSYLCACCRLDFITESFLEITPDNLSDYKIEDGVILWDAPKKLIHLWEPELSDVLRNMVSARTLGPAPPIGGICNDCLTTDKKLELLLPFLRTRNWL